MKTIKNRKLTSRYLANPRLSNGLTKQYRKYAHTRKYEHNITYNQDAGGLFDYLGLKIKLHEVNKIFGKINVLEKRVKKEVDSYDVQDRSFESIAKKAAEYQTNYILSYRKYVILKIYLKDKEQNDAKLDSTRIEGYKNDMELHRKKAVQSITNYESQSKEMAKYIPEFIRISKKLEKELVEFNKIANLEMKIQPFQNKLRIIKERANFAEGKTGLSSKDKQILNKYKSNKADYDRILDLSEQNLQTVRDIQKKITDLLSKTSYYKNQFGIFKQEKKGLSTSGQLGKSINKATKTLKEWSSKEEKLGEDLLQVNDKLGKILDTLNDIRKAITSCASALATIPESLDREFRTQAVIWFKDNIEDAISVIVEMKIHFSNMKKDFYNQISADRMFVNYVYNSRFLNFIEKRLALYDYTIEVAIKRNEKLIRPNMPTKEPSSGGFYKLSGGSGRRATTGRTTHTPRPECRLCDSIKKNHSNLKDKQLKYWFELAANFNDFKDSNNKCYRERDLKDCIKKLFDFYLLGLFLYEDILDGTTLNNSTYLNSIQFCSEILKILEKPLNDDNKKLIAQKFNKISPIDLSWTRFDRTTIGDKNLSDLFDATTGKGKSTPPLTVAEKAFTDAIDSKTHIADAMQKILNAGGTNFYGILEYERLLGKAELINKIDDFKNAYDDATYNGELAAITGGVSATATSTTTSTPLGTYSTTSKTLNNSQLDDYRDKLDEIDDAVNGSQRYLYNDEYRDFYKLLKSIYQNLSKIYKDYLDSKTNLPIPQKDIYEQRLLEVYNNFKKTVNLPSTVINDILNNLNQIDDLYENIIKGYDEYMLDFKDDSIAKAGIKLLIGQLANNATVSPTTFGNSFQNIYSTLQTNQQKIIAGHPAASITAGTILASSGLSAASATKNDGKKADNKKNDVPKPLWYEELDRISKKNADVLEDILVRIPSDYTWVLETVETGFRTIKEKLDILTETDIMSGLSKHFADMTQNLLQLKEIEGDIIKVEIKEYKRSDLGLQDYILPPVSIEMKGIASPEKVKTIMDKFWKDKVSWDIGKVRDDEGVSRLFNVLLTKSFRETPHLTGNDIGLISKNNDNLQLLLEKVEKYAESNYALLSQNPQNAQDPNRITDTQYNLCRLLDGVYYVLNDEQRTKVMETRNKIHSTCNKQQQRKGGRGGQGGQGGKPWE